MWDRPFWFPPDLLEYAVDNIGVPHWNTLLNCQINHADSEANESNYGGAYSG
jgi:hypothetical protein